MKYSKFIFKDYVFDKNTQELQLYYSYDGEIEFLETFKFNFAFVDYDELILKRAIESLFFIAGVSYFKAFLAEDIQIDKGELTREMTEFLKRTYQKGLGELFYLNKLDPETPINFQPNTEILSSLNPSTSDGVKLVAIGGGKDSLVSIELLKKSSQDIRTWSVGHRPILEPLVKEIGLEHYWVERQWDRSLLAHNQNGAFNGHVPVSAIIACVGTLVGILSGHSDVVVSNEASASEPNLSYRGVDINHQYSKSLAFEKDYQNYLGDTLNDQFSYYSFLRPLSEVRIAEIFAKTGFDKYKGVFSSCNQAFTHKSDQLFWCGHCPKCAFTYLIFAPFIDDDELISIWGKNLLLEPELEHTYRQLLGIADNKPLDCVGEIKESRTAMRLCQKLYPKLNKYEFAIPGDYDYKLMGGDSMPSELRAYLEQSIKKLDL